MIYINFRAYAQNEKIAQILKLAGMLSKPTYWMEHTLIFFFRGASSVFRSNAYAWATSSVRANDDGWETKQMKEVQEVKKRLNTGLLQFLPETIIHPN